MPPPILITQESRNSPHSCPVGVVRSILIVIARYVYTGEKERKHTQLPLLLLIRLSAHVRSTTVFITSFISTHDPRVFVESRQTTAATTSHPKAN